MARRRSITVTCTQGACREYTFFEYGTQAEAAAVRKRAATWKCTRHADAELVLTPDSRERVGVLVATTRYGSPDWRTGEVEPLGRFWVPEGASSGSGFAYGPGYKAHADDFPEGTRLVVTARIELPETNEEVA